MNGLDFGTAIGLIKGLGSPDPAVIESAVSDWLDDHPEATTTVQDGSITKAKLDNSLQGTVDDVADLKSDLQNKTLIAHPVEFESGSYASADGAKSSSTTRIRSVGYVNLQYELCKIKSTTRKVMAVAYDKSGTYVGVVQNDGTLQKSGNWVTEIDVPTGYLYKINCAKTDDSSISPSDVDITYTYYNLPILTDRTSFEQGTISASTGAKSSSSTRIRSVMPFNNLLAVSCDDGYEATVIAFSQAGTCKGSVLSDTYTTSAIWGSKIEINTTGDYCYILARKVSGANIAPSDSANIHVITSADNVIQQVSLTADASESLLDAGKIIADNIANYFLNDSGVPQSSTYWKLWVAKVKPGKTYRIRTYLSEVGDSVTSKVAFAVCNNSVAAVSDITAQTIIDTSEIYGGSTYGYTASAGEREFRYKVPANGISLVIASAKSYTDVEIVMIPEISLYMEDLTKEKISPSDFIEACETGTSCAVVRGDPSGNYAQFTAASAKTEHVKFDIAITEGQILICEFYGKADTEAGDAYILVNFYDNLIGNLVTPYHGDILSTAIRKYHKYGWVAPYGATKAVVYVCTKNSCDCELSKFNVYTTHYSGARERTGILFDAHLGMIQIAPRNTMPAFELVKKGGFKSFITNVNVTSDDVLVALHNDTINETSDGTGYVYNYTYQQLLAFDFGSWFGANYKGTRIPKLEEVTRFAAVSGMEIIYRMHHSWANTAHDTYTNQIYSWIKKYGLVGFATLKCHATADVDYYKAIFGDDVKYIYYLEAGTSVNQTLIDWAISFEGDLTVEVNDTTTDEGIASLVSAGIKTSIYTINDMYVMKDKIKRGITRFCTDTFSDIVIPLD